MKSYYDKPVFLGHWEEDLDGCINVFNTMAEMCEVSPREKLRAIPVTLTDDALNLYANNSRSCKSFEEAIDLLRSWYNRDDRKARMLTNWQSMTLSEAMEHEPNESEVTIFRKFTATLISLQEKLDSSYHSDTFFRNRILTAVNIPAI